ncbi:hypothetical protein DXG01_014793 [Tephrocybe rancida]|nr:hypothetical protein DXG01_014793 [Tephrocybe rancida]
MTDPTPVPHFFRLYRGSDTVEKAMTRHRRYLWSYLSLKQGMKILDIGSGFGTAAIDLSHYAGVSVIGIENDSFKVEQSTNVALSGDIQDRVSFVKESLQTTPSFLDVYEQVQYVLKPGGKVASYDWCWTNMFDCNNPDHCRLANLVEGSTNIGHRDTDGRSIQRAPHALESTGFRVLAHNDLTGSEKSSIIPWYIHLRDIVGNSHLPRWAFIDSSPQYSSQARYSFGLTKDAASILQQAGGFKLFTPMAMFVAQKIVQ